MSCMRGMKRCNSTSTISRFQPEVLFELCSSHVHADDNSGLMNDKFLRRELWRDMFVSVDAWAKRQTWFQKIVPVLTIPYYDSRNRKHWGMPMSVQWYKFMWKQIYCCIMECHREQACHETEDKNVMRKKMIALRCLFRLHRCTQFNLPKPPDDFAMLC